MKWILENAQSESFFCKWLQFGDKFIPRMCVKQEEAKRYDTEAEALRDSGRHYGLIGYEPVRVEENRQ